MDQRKNKIVYVGLSGGVDSSVTAAFLKNEGYDVRGVFIRVWYPDFITCTWREDRRDAMRVCDRLGISFETLDLEKEYKKEVVEYMISEYKKGRTPNPDVMCNTHIKFGSFLSWALSRGADYIATGHYVRREPESGEENNPILLSGVDPDKDQSYFLWNIKGNNLKNMLFPIGRYHKSEVRVLAERYNLPTATKKDSQGLCFMGAVDIKEFLSRFIDLKPGNVLDQEGNVIGTHDGAELYTIGQRHGFTIEKKTTTDAPRYVISKNVQENTITVGERTNENTAVNGMILESENWIREVPEEGKEYLARFRYRQKLFPILITRKEQRYIATCKESQHDVAAGQSLVVYDKDVCIGGGVISSIF